MEDQVKCLRIKFNTKMKTIFASYGYGIHEDWSKIYSNDILRIKDPIELIEIVFK